MRNKILVTDTLFIFDEHIQRLNAAGYDVVRLKKPNATEEELCRAIKGKAGYILGGVEKVTDKVIESADQLQAIFFTGTSYKYFIPGIELATERGIAIGAASHANADAVADWTFAAGVAMTRNLFALGCTGSETFQTTYQLSELQVGIIGLGHVGSRLADQFHGAGAKKVVYWSQHEKKSPYKRVELNKLLRTSDIVICSVSVDAGHGWFDETKFTKMKEGTLFTCLSDDVLDEQALLARLQTGKLRAYLDWTPKTSGYKKLPLSRFYCSNESAAYNTHAANKLASDWATTSMVHLLKTGRDKLRVR